MCTDRIANGSGLLKRDTGGGGNKLNRCVRSRSRQRGKGGRRDLTVKTVTRKSSWSGDDM